MICQIYFIIFLCFSLILFFLGLYLLSFKYEILVEFNILSLNSLSIEMVLFFDWVSFIFMSFVFYISCMIIKYSGEYMLGDKKLKQFIYLMVLFVFSMMMVITSLNLISILLGWDGLGLVSYLLVIYYQNEKSYSAGMLTALLNRIGDSAILMSIAWMFDIGSWNFLIYLKDFPKFDSLFMVSSFIILAAMTKSAQIPFSSWLPAAMAAPTPVSSLVHSSTLVTAGVYLLIRFSPLFFEGSMKFLLYCSLLTMFMAGVCANFEFDLKKIIALSTLSQLGMMIFILSLGSCELAFFHLLVHALFKAMLFMCAGVIIHNLKDCQDIRFMGGLIYFLPVTCTCMNISNMALCGIPFLSGFYSKDLIAEVLSMKMVSIFIYMLFFVSIGLTVAYSIRLSYYMFFGDFNMLSMNYLFENNNKIMLESMLGLVFLVIFKGSILFWLFFPSPYFIILPFSMKMMTLFMIFMGVLLGYELSSMNYLYKLKSFDMFMLSIFFSSMWNLPILSTFGTSKYPLLLGNMYSYKLDSGWMEYYGGQNLSFMIIKFSKWLQLLSFNHLKIFLTLMLVFLVYLLVSMS
uniref:NADH-ubiquinone oxidoreductase chain 5 n=1 Tax=Kyklioacalles sp. BMNH 1043787 TaxID=2834675 RepID=A0A8F5A3W6_9CUCU|nr:NADH dehydrogenase subunit 5 [Kyklioacalles sp. BMNH 1043787]